MPAVCGRAGDCFSGECLIRSEALIDDGDPCTVDVCDGASGEVQHLLQEPGTACDNDDACDGLLDQCDAAGACLGTEEPELPELDAACQVAACDPALGIVVLAAPRGTACGERMVCDDEGACVPGASPECELECAIRERNCGEMDYDACVLDCALVSTGLCAEQRRASQECVLAHPDICAGRSCGPEDEALFNCQSSACGSAPLEREDCTIYSCTDNQLVVQQAPDGTPCEAHFGCGVGTCNAGFCHPSMTDRCISRDGPGICVIPEGVAGCFPTVQIPSPCYDPEFQALREPGTPCQLGPCSEEGFCDRFGRCLAEPRPGGSDCEDGDVCNGTGVCGGENAPFECVLQAGPIEADDGDPCTEDACDPVTGEVSHALLTSGASCEDANVCNGTGEVCDDTGECVVTLPPPELEDGNPCTDGGCDPALGPFQVNVPDGTSCADNNPCNGEEICHFGACHAGNPLPIPNDDPCVVRSCDPQLGLVEEPAPAGTICTVSESACHEDSRCDGAGQCVPGAPVPIDDGNPCTVDTCTPEGGIEHVYVLPEDGNPCTDADCDVETGPVQLPAAPGTACPDGDLCNGDEVCDGAGACVAGAPPVVDDANPCTLDGCDDGDGVVHQPARGGTSCSDDDACNGEEICDGAGHCLAGVPLPIDDGRNCTSDECDPEYGVVHTWIEDEQCQAPTWQTLASSAPSPRDSAAATFVSTTSELFVFGGENGGVALGDTWLFDTQTRRWRTSSASSPPARAGAVAVYDELNDRVLVFGGASGSTPGSSYSDETWEYDPVNDSWSPLDVAGPRPAARAYAAVTYDSERDRVVMFGGVAAQGGLGDTWELDPSSATWSLRTSSGPSARGGAALAYDASRGRSVLFGGAPRVLATSGAPLADVWEFDGDTGTWTEPAGTNAPPARSGHALLYDTARQRVRLLGGAAEQPGALSDVWEYDVQADVWQPLAQVNVPARAGHYFGYDAASGTAFAALGLSYSASGLVTPAFSDVLQVDGPTGTWREVTGRVAPASTWPGLVYDHQRGLLVTLGHLPATNREAVWEFDRRAGTWQQRDLVAQTEELLGADRFTTVAYDTDRQRTIAVEVRGVIFPGPPRIWEWDGSRLTRGCSTPQLRVGSATAYDPVRKRLMFFGGSASIGPEVGELWEVDLASCAIRARNGLGNLGRRDALSVWDGQRSRMIVHGGRRLSTILDDTWQWDAASGTWKQLAIGTQPRPPLAVPEHSAMAYDPIASRVLWFSTRFDLAAQTWQLNPATGVWTQLAVSGGPEEGVVSAAFDAGRGNVVLLDADANLWDFTGSSWEMRELSVAPAARSGAAGSWVSEAGYGLLFGGISGDGHRRFLADTWLWRNGWKLASSGESNPSPTGYRATAPMTPAARAGHAVATAAEGVEPEDAALLFGGENDSGLLGDTWLFDRETFEWVGFASNIVSARTEHALAPIPGVGYLLFGGADAAGPRGDTYVFTLSPRLQRGWAADRSAGSVVAPRWGHAMALDVERGTIVLFGGRDGQQVFGDTWEYNPASVPRWTERQPRVSPPARFGHELTYDPERGTIVLTGGSGASAGGTLGDTWEWNAAENLWVRRLPERSMPPRAGHVAFFDAQRSELLCFGGLQYAQGGRAASSFGDTLAFENAASTADEGARFPLGASCDSASQCESGSCVDGFCCNTACTGQCAACDSPGQEGRCVAIQGAPRGDRPACAGSDPCAQCGGVRLDACGLDEGAECGPSSCQAGIMYEAGRCVSGVCTDADADNCEPYNCNADGCRTRCGTDKDCYSGYFCRVDHLLGSCRSYAVLSEVRSPYTDVRVGSDAAILAWVVDPPAQFRFSYLDAAGQRVFACGTQYANNNECRFTPAQAGTFRWRVEARARGSSRAFDDARELDVTVLP